MIGGGGLHPQQQQQWQMMMNNANHLKRDREDDMSFDDPLRNPAKRVDTGVGKGGVPGFGSPMGVPGSAMPGGPGYGGMPHQNAHGMGMQPNGMLPPGAVPGVDQHQQHTGQQQQPHPGATAFPSAGVSNPQTGGIASPVSRPSPTHHSSSGSIANGMVPAQSSPLATVPPATPQQPAAGIHQQQPSQQQHQQQPVNLSGEAIQMQLRARHAQQQQMMLQQQQQQQHLRQQQLPPQQQPGGQPGGGIPGSNPGAAGAMNGGMNMPAPSGGTLLGGPAPGLAMPGQQQPLTSQQSQAVFAQAVAAVRQGPSNSFVQHLMKSNPQFQSLPFQSQVQAVSALQVRAQLSLSRNWSFLERRF